MPLCRRMGGQHDVGGFQSGKTDSQIIALGD